MKDETSSINYAISLRTAAQIGLLRDLRAQEQRSHEYQCQRNTSSPPLTLELLCSILDEALALTEDIPWTLAPASSQDMGVAAPLPRSRLHDTTNTSTTSTSTTTRGATRPHHRLSIDSDGRHDDNDQQHRPDPMPPPAGGRAPRQ
jgi:hypothetical protein